MRLFVNQIEGSGLTRTGRQEVAELSQHFSRRLGLDAAFCEPLNYAVKAQIANEIVEIEGHLETIVELSCSRCLNPYRYVLATDFDVAFTRQDLFADGEQQDEDGIELDSDSLGLSSFSGDEIDLEECFYEQIVLALPARPLCSHQCKGLCQQCGADLNRDACQCDPNPFNNKFGALKGLKID